MNNQNTGKHITNTPKTLDEVQRNFWIVIENMEDAFWMATPGFNEIVYINPSYERIWGISRERLYEEPRAFFDTLHPEDRDVVEAGIRGHSNGKWSFEYRIVRPDGSIRWIKDKGFPLRNDQGILKMMAGIASDISKAKTLENEIMHYISDLERSNKHLEEFAYISSHDLQEPLRKIQTFGGRLAVKYADQLGEDGRDYLERMNRAATRMRRLIDDLLDYSRIATRPRAFSTVEIRQIIREAVSNLDALVEETGGSIEIDDFSIPVEADPTEMLQLFQNLIANSLKFHRRDVSPVVTIHGHLVPALRINPKGRTPSPRTCMITIKDNGIGFDEKYADRIFEPFQRLHGRFEYEGTGMGLAICSKIVDRHEGDISVKSAPGKGSIFSVTLPLRQRKGQIKHCNKTAIGGIISNDGQTNIPGAYHRG